MGMNQFDFFGKLPCVSIILHHLLKELPTELVSSNAVEILQLIECSKDYSIDQCLNYRLLGFRISERKSQSDIVDAVVDKIIQVASEHNNLQEYLKVVDAYVDIILQNQMDNNLNVVLNGIVKRASEEGIGEIELTNLQSIILKLVTHINNLEGIFSLSHFVEILDMMHGSSRSIVNMQILNLATRKGSIRDPTFIQLLFELSQSLHDGMDYSNMKNDDNQQCARLISRFVNMVDYGPDLEHHLAFLVECRGAFCGINELKGTLIHSSNCLAVKAMKGGQNHISFVKSCMAFSEVTIPSVPSYVKQLNLYLETIEVALFGGLVSHSDGLLGSAIICLQTLDLMDGNPEQGVTYIPRSILALINSQSWMPSRMRTTVLCTIVSLAATLSQFKLPYHANHEQLLPLPLGVSTVIERERWRESETAGEEMKILGNECLFFGDPTYLQELRSLSAFVLQNLVDNVMQEPSQVARGSMALEACNCIASSFKLSHEVSPFFSKLMETAKLCLSPNDKYLRSTIKFVDRFLQTSS
ncbi:hypothetical protein U1Q18_024059 [Sarracenia purpurea var. burkii]